MEDVYGISNADYACAGGLTPRELAGDFRAGSVAAALVTDSGKVYRDICAGPPCGLGFCAEQAAVAATLTAGESRIVRLVAVCEEGLLPPCGRCRELLYQINYENLKSEILTESGAMPLFELLPQIWRA